MANRNSKDTRPSRQKQKERTTSNKIKQLERTVLEHPKDKNAMKKLEFLRTGKGRFRMNVHPTAPIIHRYADGKVKRDDKKKK